MQQSNETNAPSPVATATAVQSTTEKGPQKIIKPTFHASKPSKETLPGTKRPQRGKTLPLRSTHQSPAKQAETIVPKEKLPTSTAQVNLDKELKDTDESSDESQDDEAAVNVPQKDGDISRYDQMFAIMPRFCPINNWNKYGMSDKTFDIFHV